MLTSAELILSFCQIRVSSVFLQHLSDDFFSISQSCDLSEIFRRFNHFTCLDCWSDSFRFTSIQKEFSWCSHWWPAVPCEMGCHWLRVWRQLRWAFLCIYVPFLGVWVIFDVKHTLQECFLSHVCKLCSWLLMCPGCTLHDKIDSSSEDEMKCAAFPPPQITLIIMYFLKLVICIETECTTEIFSGSKAANS